MAEEASKLRTHLDLVRKEYVKLQSKYASLENRYQVLAASSGKESSDSFASRLLKAVNKLFNCQSYSDVTINLKDQNLFGHKFVLQARSQVWAALQEGQEVDLTIYPSNVAYEFVKWLYTNEANLSQSDDFRLEMLRASRKFDLESLAEKCEEALITSVGVRNCIKFYQTAEEISATILKEHCSTLISTHWEDFTSGDFEALTPELAYQMFKSKTKFPLHCAIRNRREDVVFLYLMEHDAQLPAKLNELDDRGDLPLDLALKGHCEGIASTLVKHKVNISICDHGGRSLLHRAVLRGDEFSCHFLIHNGADIHMPLPDTGQTVLHLLAGLKRSQAVPEDQVLGMTSIASQLLVKGAKANVKDKEGNTPLHVAVASHNDLMFSVLLDRSDLDLELQNQQGETALGLALQYYEQGTSESNSLAYRLLKKGSSPDAILNHTGDSLLHLAARAGNEAAALFLIDNGASVNLINQQGETPLHTACLRGLPTLALTLLRKGANPNCQTVSPLQGCDVTTYRQTPLHVAIMNQHKGVVDVVLAYKDEVMLSGSASQIIPKFTLKDSKEHTVLALTLWQSYTDVARQLIRGGASVNDTNNEGCSLLHQAIAREDEASALFLIEQGCDCNALTQDHKCPLQLAIVHDLDAVVQALCRHKVDINVRDEAGDCPLWQALELGREELAAILVQNGCDADMWGPGPDGCQQTLLHRAIDESNEAIACFLIRSSCSVNVTRRPGLNGEGEEVGRDGQTPLHLCCTWGLEITATTLLEHQADVNKQDAEGKTALHIAIESQHLRLVYALLIHPQLNVSLSDKKGTTAFAAAMLVKNNKAAQAVLDREPSAAEQYDSRGKNFLHSAILRDDLESVLFLLSVHVSVNSRTRDANQRTPLHLAVQVGNEMVGRNLLLAGANVKEVTPQKKTALHIAAEYDHAILCQILIENGCPYDLTDDSLNNALHIACQMGHLSTIKVLLTETQINAAAINMRGQNPLHLLGQFGKENAAAIFELFKETMPSYDIDQPDINGNTVLMLAYFNGHSSLCRAIVRAGAALGTSNKEGMSIFNAPVATKQLLFKLLDMLTKEPPWVDGDSCQECGIKFGITTRKHHCRHCGRLLCSKCSSKDMPIVKYNVSKPVRICEVCFDVLTLGCAGAM